MRFSQDSSGRQGNHIDIQSGCSEHNTNAKRFRRCATVQLRRPAGSPGCSGHRAGRRSRTLPSSACVAHLVARIAVREGVSRHARSAGRCP
jgi:hypothetical protein